MSQSTIFQSRPDVASASRVLTVKYSGELMCLAQGHNMVAGAPSGDQTQNLSIENMMLYLYASTLVYIIYNYQFTVNTVWENISMYTQKPVN